MLIIFRENELNCVYIKVKIKLLNGIYIEYLVWLIYQVFYQ